MRIAHPIVLLVRAVRHVARRAHQPHPNRIEQHTRSHHEGHMRLASYMAAGSAAAAGATSGHAWRQQGGPQHVSISARGGIRSRQRSTSAHDFDGQNQPGCRNRGLPLS